MNKETSQYELAQLLIMVAEDIRSLADCLQALSVEMKESSSPESEVEQTPKTPGNELADISLEQVRGVLADKSRNGHTAEVRAIIQKYGAERLSEIDPKDYPEVLKDAEALQ